MLAAGLSRRMGAQKLLLPLADGRTILETVLERMAAAGCDEVVAVVSDPVLRGLPRLADRARIVRNPCPEEGQSGSLRLGLGAIPAGEAFCLMLGDLPCVAAAQVEAYLRRFEERAPGLSALVPRRDGVFGHPSFFSGVWRGRMLDASGDVGGRAVILRYADEVLWTDGEDGFFRDVDTPDDYAGLLREAEGGAPA